MTYNPHKTYTRTFRASDLVPFYNENALVIAHLCDNFLDKSGALLGYVRDLAHWPEKFPTGGLREQLASRALPIGEEAIIYILDPVASTFNANRKERPDMYEPLTTDTVMMEMRYNDAATKARAILNRLGCVNVMEK